MSCGTAYDGGISSPSEAASPGSSVQKETAETTDAAPDPVADTGSSAESEKAPDAEPARAEVVFAGGCFWCVEAVFEELDGVSEAISGYAGGTAETANYQAVCSGLTDHAEVVKIVFDPSRISYEELLKVHFATHDPTTLNRQGNDRGPQYRSSIFYADEQEKELAQAVIDDLTDAKVFDDPIVTKLEPLTEFFLAEEYHQNYVCLNPGKGYVRGVALPKVEKVRAKFQDKLKAKSPLEQ
ncbi:MAG: peptide-methionine (S)-S-oxide reductase MsrA [bacterium]|nr:peptide-methionine (S)-S-oxide reductase MsrA [bacterium]